MPPPPPPTDVYPCLDWVPEGVAKAKPEKLRLTNEELRTVIASAKERALEARRRLGQVVRAERLSCNQSNNNNNGNNSNNNNNPEVEMREVPDHVDARNNEVDDDDAIMREYGLDNYDDEDEVGVNIRHETGDEVSEDDNDENTNVTRGVPQGLASEIAAQVYHASNADDPYLREGGAANLDEDDEDEENLIIKPTDNLIVAGHVHKDESSIEVYVYDNDTESFYLHHDIIQSDYPCCVRWIGHYRNQTKNLAAAGYMNPEILLWDLDVIDVLEPLETLSGHKDAVIDLSWNHHSKETIASGSADRHVRLWNLDECKSVSNIKLSGKVSALEFGLYEQFLLLAGDLDKNVSVIDTRISSVIAKWKLTGEVERVRWIPTDQSKFLVSDDQGYIYCFDLRNVKTDRPEVKFHAHEISVTGLEFSPQSDNMLVTASADNTVKVWDTKAILRNSVEPTPIKEITDLSVGNILSLRMCPGSRAKMVVGGSKMAVISEEEIFNVLNE